MIATVSARVPVEVRNQVYQKLRRTGSTPSKFINEVYLNYLNGDLGLKSKGFFNDNAFSVDEAIQMLKHSACNYEDPLPATFDFKAELENERAREAN